MERFAGKTILVTGGAMGIGRATAARLVSEGAEVIIADIDTGAGEAAAAALSADGGQATFLHVDLSSEESICAMAGQARAGWKKLDGLVNCAGIYVGGSLEQTGGADWSPQVQINLLAPAICIRELLPLIKAGPGHIVNLSSEGAYKPYKSRWVYDATKQGLISLTRAAACELVDFGVRSNAVAPGWIVTEMHFAKSENPAARKKELEEMDMNGAIMNRLGRPEEIAAGIAYLLSDDASYVTGTVLHIDGGRVAR